MTDFSFTDDQLLVQRLARDWARAEVTPTIQKRDQQGEFDRSLLSKMADNGLLGLSIPARYGGTGNDYIALGLRQDEPTRVSLPRPE